MMKKMIKFLTIALLVSQSAFATEQAEIVKVIKQYESALNNSNADRIIDLYSNTPTFMPQHAPAQIGKDQVYKAYKGVFSAIKLKIDFAIHELEINGDTAWVRTSSAGKTQILANEMTINEGNNELFIFKKEAGNWKIHQYIFSTNQARK